MKVYLYRLSDESQVRFSLSKSVDQIFWRDLGKSIEWLDMSQSIHTAFQKMNRHQRIQNKVTQAMDEPSYQRHPTNYKSLACRLYRLFQGRVLLYGEIQQWVKYYRKDLIEHELLAAMQWLYLTNQLQISPGVTWGRFAIFARCQRCQAGFSYLTRYSCATCGENCAMCNHCYLLGPSKSCTPLFFFLPSRRQTQRSISVQLQMSQTLTEWQYKTIGKINKFLSSNQKQLLLWAVTGAGKTECMIFAIKMFLEQGKRVVWISPRKDVVLEIAPRLKEIFPQVQMTVLYGGSPDRFHTGSLVIATAHQTLRFYQMFDLAIIDEVDAFPLYRNRMLETGIHRALTTQGKQILLTATPPSSWKRSVRHGELAHVLLPVRYHGYPLPEPELKLEKKLWKKLKKNNPNLCLRQFLEQVIANNGQAILFVARIQDLFLVHHWLSKWGSSEQEIALVFAQDEERDEKIRLFRKGRIRFLISTTILERGVTVEKCHVAVIGADHPIFNSSSLIQIAGRVGRSASYQQGMVWFIAQEKTNAQIQAIQEIKRLNQNMKFEGNGR